MQSQPGWAKTTLSMAVSPLSDTYNPYSPISIRFSGEDEGPWSGLLQAPNRTIANIITKGTGLRSDIPASSRACLLIFLIRIGQAPFSYPAYPACFKYALLTHSLLS